MLEYHVHLNVLMLLLRNMTNILNLILIFQFLLVEFSNNCISYDKILNDCHNIDVISLGEGEISTVKYLKYIIGNMELIDINGIEFRESENKIIANYPISVIEKLDELPLPAKDFLKIWKKNLKQVSII